ncbi:MAG: 4-hydroxy-tetrahydrodipicolinate reductase [Deltaproteobacteria bacterium]|nr:4-hydroxy-tetrahydrodipicolinate reductase [Deltaproteobacteria bacterium]MBW2071906.1 4-hydroxy-tetrahydrodipicolinate reductase [Deltaproteobacteria bacterium]
MVKAVVAGAAGRMGGRIIHTIQESEAISLAAAFEKADHPSVGKDVGELLGLGSLGIKVAGDLQSVIDSGDVVIDFTFHEASVLHLRQAAAAGKPMVIGTTGFDTEEIEAIRSLAREIPCVLAPNMSMGVNLIFKLVADIARILGDGFDIEIIEAHHHHKKDAPSGTAMKIAQIIASTLGRDLDKVGVFERRGLIGERRPEEIGIQTIRGGDIVGEHTIIFAGVGERIELTHRAHSRDNFARGAVKAAQWVVAQEPGLYDMQHVLGLK